MTPRTTCSHCGMDRSMTGDTYRRLIDTVTAITAERDAALKLAERHMNQRHKAEKQSAEDWNNAQEQLAFMRKERDAAEKRLDVARQRLLETETARCAALAERDAAETLVAVNLRNNKALGAANVVLGKERDAARAEAARLREALPELVATAWRCGNDEATSYEWGARYTGDSREEVLREWLAALATDARDE